MSQNTILANAQACSAVKYMQKNNKDSVIYPILNPYYGSQIKKNEPPFIQYPINHENGHPRCIRPIVDFDDGQKSLKCETCAKSFEAKQWYFDISLNHAISLIEGKKEAQSSQCVKFHQNGDWEYQTIPYDEAIFIEEYDSKNDPFIQALNQMEQQMLKEAEKYNHIILTQDPNLIDECYEAIAKHLPNK